MMAALACLTARSTFGASLPTNEVFLSSNATFVLISGLPGDAESENAYQDQMRSWLDTISIGQRAGRCIIFTDQPPTITASNTSSIQVLKADRAHVLALSETLADEQNPLRVIVWGHGGKQGSIPVLHVRGERLTPSDFAALADKLPHVPSQWVLMFRGSGAFGRALAKTGRQILTSDDEVMFGSDPNAMPLLLKALRSQPTATFGHLAESLGGSTSEWYAQRNLARTEELTLWAEGTDRRHLGADKGLQTQEVQNQQPQRPAQSPDLAQSASPAKPTSPAPKGSPWNDLPKARPEDFPGADAVVLRLCYTSILGSSPALSNEREEFIQILKPEGRRYGDFDVSFDPPEEELEFLNCEMLHPEGGIEKLDPEGIEGAEERSPGDYHTARRKFFSLPGVVPGSILYVRYRSQWKDYPLPRVSMAIPIGGDLPVLDATIVVRCPKDSPIHYFLKEAKAAGPVVAKTDYSSSYTWHLTNVSPTSAEALSAPRRQPALLISTFADWHAFADWYSHITQMTAEVTPELKTKAEELTRGASSPREKVEALFNYVTGLRYVAIPLGISSLRPHAAGNVLQNQFGDCKDKANLLNALLHASRIEANLVLVPRFGQAHQEVPGLFFNHAISRVNLAGETLWLDSTDEACRFGWLPPGDAGRNVLVIDGQTALLTELPASDANHNQLSIKGKLKCSQPSADCSVELDTSADGYVDYQLRNAAEQGGDQIGSPPLLGSLLHPLAGSFAVARQKSTSRSALDQRFNWHAEGTCIGVVSSLNRKWIVHSPFWIPREWDLALNQRKSPLFLNEGYPLALQEQFEIALPGGVEVTDLPRPVEGSQAPLSWRVQWEKKNQGIVARFQATLTRGDLSSSETSSFQNQLRELIRALRSDALVSGAALPEVSLKTSQN